MSLNAFARKKPEEIFFCFWCLNMLMFVVVKSSCNSWALIRFETLVCFVSLSNLERHTSLRAVLCQMSRCLFNSSLVFKDSTQMCQT